MICRNCNKQISDEGISFCPHCGSYLRENTAHKTTVVIKPPTRFQEVKHEEEPVEFFKNKNKKNKKDGSKRKTTKADLFVYLIIMCLWVVALIMLLKATNEDYYFSENNNQNNGTSTNVPTTPSEPTTPSDPVTETPSNHINTSGVTSIVYNNKYLKQYSIGSREDVLSLIRNDSINQKQSCPQDVLKVEQEIINSYGITAINLCEMDLDFAIELKNVIGYVYNNFPNARFRLTNMTLANVTDGSYMAAFIPIFTFATNNNNSGYPMGIKTMIILNAKYFLDTRKINNSVNYGVSTGYFPANATRSSTVAHEFGHYLSFVALMNKYSTTQITLVNASDSYNFYSIYDDFNEGNYSYKIIEEAYNKYKMAYGNDITIDQFRSSISSYAVATNSDGNYIYDETIAEAFHDCYLNGDNAKIASKLIMSVLKGYLV